MADTREEREQLAAQAMLRAGKIPEPAVLGAINDRDLQYLIDYYGAPNATESTDERDARGQEKAHSARTG